MSKTVVIDQEKHNKIVQESYKILKEKDTTNKTKDTTLNDLVKMIEEVLKDENS